MKSESALQQQIFNWYNNNYCLKNTVNRGMIFSIPNGGTRHIMEAMTLKATGLLKGASDLIVILPSKKLIFVESKVDALDMRMVGQLIGYCLVAQPKEAFLLSTQSLSPRLVNALSAKPEVLIYGNGQRIQIGQIKGKNVEIHAI